ncbi:MAG: hypothetical protein CMJ52_07050 [Planctomycetaceae bacterium]|nr:hypothetical protein [Planctomycetaceae bacterium]
MVAGRRHGVNTATEARSIDPTARKAGHSALSEDTALRITTGWCRDARGIRPPRSDRPSPRGPVVPIRRGRRSGRSGAGGDFRGHLLHQADPGSEGRPASPASRPVTSW